LCEVSPTCVLSFGKYTTLVIILGPRPIAVQGKIVPNLEKLYDAVGTTTLTSMQANQANVPYSTKRSNVENAIQAIKRPALRVTSGHVVIKMVNLPRFRL
jgi:hypothetical protein